MPVDETMQRRGIDRRRMTINDLGGGCRTHGPLAFT
jgi:hypothetical protein